MARNHTEDHSRLPPGRLLTRSATPTAARSSSRACSSLACSPWAHGTGSGRCRRSPARCARGRRRVARASRCAVRCARRSHSASRRSPRPAHLRATRRARSRRPVRTPPPRTSAPLGPSSRSSPHSPARTRSTSTCRADGSQWNATKELTGDASLPGRDIAPIELQPRKAGPGHYVIGGAPLAPAGDWTLEVVALVSDFDEFRTRFQVPIK
jgi:hypothetical protein